ncbi:Putative Glycoside hydrolase family 78 protein [[Torrubiella] hemipterigena]|uniref:Putative Glycoside hydrolase family 78 protein n=1 Tax=[Torrubiella] hemipterigena TaxID=1531966 RepID=A0A0A1T5Y3_9HYPO|nr:Putative Glycoside hydrolase family 78 protein [[Torrubiella] hemipterigena]
MKVQSEKPSVAEHIETATATDGDSDHGLFKSRYDQLSLPQTLWVFKRVILVTLAVYTGYVCEGFELGAGGTVIANAGFIKQFGSRDGTGVRALDPTWVSTWSSLLNVGQIVTFTHISWFADKYGRKTSFYLAWLWLVVGCTLLNTAKTPAVWAIAKLCNGAGIGVLQVVCQVYVMEISPNRIRGGLVTFQAVWSNIGSIICSVMMQHLNQTYPDDYILAMRILWAPVGLMILCWVFIPESPWFHARHGNKEKAIRAMTQLYGGIPDFDFEEEYSIIERTIKHEKQMLQAGPGYLQVFKGLNLKRTLTVMLLAMSQQLVGLAIISTYSTYFFSLAGLQDPFLGTVILSCCNLLAVILWSFSTDKLGRRTIINTCETFICVILFVVGGLYWTGATNGNAAAATALLVICCFWTFAFQVIAMSYYLYSAELPSAFLRVKTGPIAFFTNSILGIATWRSAAEIDELYERKIPAWRWNDTVTNAEREMRAMFGEKSDIA